MKTSYREALTAVLVVQTPARSTAVMVETVTLSPIA